MTTQWITGHPHATHPHVAGVTSAGTAVPASGTAGGCARAVELQRRERHPRMLGPRGTPPPPGPSSYAAAPTPGGVAGLRPAGHVTRGWRGDRGDGPIRHRRRVPVGLVPAGARDGPARRTGVGMKIAVAGGTGTRRAASRIAGRHGAAVDRRGRRQGAARPSRARPRRHERRLLPPAGHGPRGTRTFTDWLAGHAPIPRRRPDPAGHLTGPLRPARTAAALG